MPAKGARCLTWDCPRKSWAVAGMGSGLPGAGQGRDHRAGAPGRCAKASEEGQGTDAGAGSARSRAGAGRARAGAWWRRPGARRAVGGRSPGRGAQVLLTGAPRGPPAGVGGRRRGSRGKYLKESMPAGRTCWRGPVSSTASPATARPSGPGRVAMSAATIDRYLAPVKARAVRGRSTTKGRSRLARLHQDPQGRRARWRPSPGSSRPVTVAHCGPVLEAGSRARTVEHDPMCSRGGPSPARSAGVADKAHHLGPRRRRGRDPVPRAGHGLRQRVGIHRPRRGAVGREPGASTPARSRPHGKNDQATIKTREATTWCAATPPRHRHGRRRRAPGAGPPAGAGQHQAQLTRPPPASPSGGAPAGRAGASACTTGPAHPQAGCWTPTPRPTPRRTCPPSPSPTAPTGAECGAPSRPWRPPHGSTSPAPPR